MSRLQAEALLNTSGFPVRSAKTIPPLRDRYYRIVDQPIGGDAPKAFVRVYEHEPGRVRRGKPQSWPLYIAKVGHKWYPNESITEHFLTRLGQRLGLRMADSRLMNVHGQIRFFSRYFLKPNQSLVHGAQIFAGYLEDDAFVEEVEQADASREVFTFQFVVEAVRSVFPDEAETILDAFVRMLAFDAVVGNMDRHYYNWGVVTHALGAHPPYFAPIYDSARALFWNDSESKLIHRWEHASSDDERNRYLRKYVKKSQPKTGWDGEKNLNHFKLIRSIRDAYPALRGVLKDLYQPQLLEDLPVLLDGEFLHLFSPMRKRLIRACLERRLERYGDSIQST
ncbi:MAG: HipA domain-containing protein [Bacteroidota bacterium]